MAEGTEKSVGKFTIIEEAASPSGQSFAAEAASKESQQKSTKDRVASLDSGSLGQETDAFTLKTSQPRRRGRPPGTKGKEVIQAVAEAPANYNLYAQLLIGSSNTVVVTWLGAECAMERREAEMLEPPVARILARLPTSQAQKMAIFIDPMVILIALGTWGNRIIRIQRSKRATISDAELARASGMVSSPPPAPAQTGPEAEGIYQPAPVEPDLPQRTRVPVNPNGIPVAITQQMGEV